MLTYDMDLKYYQPVWRCIYCGSVKDPDKLTKEHIIPKSLGGRSVLPKSSCDECREITRIIELDATRKVLGPLRNIFDLPTDHPHERPTEIALKVRSNGQVREIQVPVTDYPGMDAVLPDFEGLPGILSIPPKQNAKIAFAQVLHRHPDFEQRIKRIKGKFGDFDEYMLEVRTLPVQFCRMLAKIAHAYAHAELADYNFSPLLTNLILKGGGADVPLLIGRLRVPLTPTPSIEGKLHRLVYGLAKIDGTLVNGEVLLPVTKNYLVVHISLFQNSGWPVYSVVVGEASQELGKFLATDSAKLLETSFA